MTKILGHIARISHILRLKYLCHKKFAVILIVTIIIAIGANVGSSRFDASIDTTILGSEKWYADKDCRCKRKRFQRAITAENRKEYADCLSSQMIAFEKAIEHHDKMAFEAAQITVANNSVRIAFYQMLTGILTLAAAAYAAWYARHAAKESGRSANAAESSVKDNRLIGQLQASSYVSVNKATIQFDNQLIMSIVVDLLNSGQSPAVMVRWDFSVNFHFTNGDMFETNRDYGTLNGVHFFLEVPASGTLTSRNISGGSVSLTKTVIRDGSMAVKNLTHSEALFEMRRGKGFAFFADIKVMWLDIFGNKKTAKYTFQKWTKEESVFSNPIQLNLITVIHEGGPLVADLIE